MRLEGERDGIHKPRASTSHARAPAAASLPKAATPPPAAATPSLSSAAAPAENAQGEPLPWQWLICQPSAARLTGYGPAAALRRVDRANIGNCACCGIRWVFDSESKSHKYNHF
jgi:hypothetical protein